MNKEKTNGRRLGLFVALGAIALLLLAGLWWQNRHERRLTRALNGKLRLTVADSVSRAAEQKRRAAVDSVRSVYENRLAAQAARYEAQRKADVQLEATYRGTGADLVLPDYR